MLSSNAKNGLDETLEILFKKQGENEIISQIKNTQVIARRES
jgi:hypothetical protein